MIVFLIALAANWLALSFSPWRNMRILYAPIGAAAFTAFWYLT